jgi:demethylmenaquinone methyltransferase / 2-methoxy-6-polyprenyl-1,4-benzoquinol methylase
MVEVIIGIHLILYFKSYRNPALQTGQNTAHPLQAYYSRIHKTYDLINHIFTFGLDKKWRNHAVDLCLKDHPYRILDLCCGTGDLAIGISRNSGNDVRITGFDLNPEMLHIAQRKAFRFPALNLEFVQGDAAFMPFRDKEFDRITIGFGLRNLVFDNPNREHYLSEIGRVMKPGARLLILESSRPENSMVCFFYRLYLRLFMVPVATAISGDRKAYRYLLKSSAGFFSFAQLQDMLGNYNLYLEKERSYLFGSVNLLIATRK